MSPAKNIKLNYFEKKWTELYKGYYPAGGSPPAASSEPALIPKTCHLPKISS
jgi:hypothetical protein